MKKTGTPKVLFAALSATVALTLPGIAITSGTAWADTGSANNQDQGSGITYDASMDPPFLQAMRTKDAWKSVSDDALIKMGHDACGTFGSTHNLLQVLGVIQSESPGTSVQDIGYLSGASIAAYCPAYLGEVEHQANRLGS
jgi:hypothetical protein